MPEKRCAERIEESQKYWSEWMAEVFEKIKDGNEDAEQEFDERWLDVHIDRFECSASTMRPVVTVHGILCCGGPHEEYRIRYSRVEHENGYQSGEVERVECFEADWFDDAVIGVDEDDHPAVWEAARYWAELGVVENLGSSFLGWMGGEV